MVGISCIIGEPGRVGRRCGGWGAGRAKPLGAGRRAGPAEPRGAPDHISRPEDKLFIVQAGSLLFRVDGEAFVASRGDRISVPRGRAHGFRAGPGGAVMVLVATPAGHDVFFRAMSDLPVPHDPDSVRKVCERFGQQIIGL